MSDRKTESNGELVSLVKIEDAFRRAFETVIHDHAWRGLPIIGWRDGKVTYTDPFTYYMDGTVPLPPHLSLSISKDGKVVITQRTPITGPFPDNDIAPSPGATPGVYPNIAPKSQGEVRS
jgi:hypothetical protein